MRRCRPSRKPCGTHGLSTRCAATDPKLNAVCVDRELCLLGPLLLAREASIVLAFVLHSTRVDVLTRDSRTAAGWRQPWRATRLQRLCLTGSRMAASSADELGMALRVNSPLTDLNLADAFSQSQRRAGPRILINRGDAGPPPLARRWLRTRCCST